MHTAAPVEFATDPEICLAYYKNSGAAREASLRWISESLQSDRNFVLKCVKVDPLILNYCKNDAILYDFEVLLKAVRNAIKNDEADDLAGAALKNDWADALVFFARSLHAKIQAHSAVKAFEDQVGSHYFAQAGAVKKLIGSYLGIVPVARKRRTLQAVWSQCSIFFLSLGGSVNELCTASKFRPKRKREVTRERKREVTCERLVWFDDSDSEESCAGKW
jgi:hypothetical protein